jgi:hypothetical protein
MANGFERYSHFKSSTLSRDDASSDKPSLPISSRMNKNSAVFCIGFLIIPQAQRHCHRQIFKANQSVSSLAAGVVKPQIKYANPQ